MNSTCTRRLIASTVILYLLASTAMALTIRENTRFSGHIITNISTVYSGTGVFNVVPQASFREPVPYWQLTNLLYQAGRFPSLVSGECDTNRTDVLFSTNYLLSAVYVWQERPTNQFVYLLTNSVVFDSFVFAGATTKRAVSVNVGQYDRLGIACSNLSSVVEFCFEGNRN